MGPDGQEGPPSALLGIDYDVARRKGQQHRPRGPRPWRRQRPPGKDEEIVPPTRTEIPLPQADGSALGLGDGGHIAADRRLPHREAEASAFAFAPTSATASASPVAVFAAAAGRPQDHGKPPLRAHRGHGLDGGRWNREPQIYVGREGGCWGDQ